MVDVMDSRSTKTVTGTGHDGDPSLEGDFPVFG